MKTIKVTVAAFLSAASLSAAAMVNFTADLSKLPFGMIPEEGLVLNVPDYGAIRFSSYPTGTGRALEVGDDLGGKGIQFDASEELLIEFLGSLPRYDILDYEYMDPDHGGDLVQDSDFYGGTYLLKYLAIVDADGNPIGDGSAVFTYLFFSAEPAAVPEASTSLLGLFGMTGLLIRRRR
jgi:hypothetical protein